MRYVEQLKMILVNNKQNDKIAYISDLDIFLSTRKTVSFVVKKVTEYIAQR